MKIAVFIGLALGNGFYALLQAPGYEDAAKLTFFQGWALLCLWFCEWVKNGRKS
jgi:hypothetical protein